MMMLYDSRQRRPITQFVHVTVTINIRPVTRFSPFPYNDQSDVPRNYKNSIPVKPTLQTLAATNRSKLNSAPLPSIPHSHHVALDCCSWWIDLSVHPFWPVVHVPIRVFTYTRCWCTPFRRNLPRRPTATCHHQP